MRLLLFTLSLGIATLLTGCASGHGATGLRDERGSTGAHTTATRALAPLAVVDPKLLPATDPNPPTYLAQAAGACWNSMSCCIQNHPLTPVQSCGADPLEAAKILKTFESLYAAANPGAKEAAEADVAEVEQVEDWTSIAELPAWKQRCIKTYYACKDKGWTGKCDDCLRYCEGQRNWPLRTCRPRKE